MIAKAKIWTRRSAAIPALVLAAWLMTGTAQPQEAKPAGTAPPSIAIQIVGLRSVRGQILTCITARPSYFPNCSKDPDAAKGRIAASAARRFSLTVPRTGIYAIALMHDENSNRDLDMALALPREGFGFSNNPPITDRPPPFRAAAFPVRGDTRVTIRMRYLL